MHNMQLPDLPKNLTGEEPPAHLADEMGDAWYAFAKYGDPSHGDIKWPAYKAEQRTMMVISDQGWTAQDDINAANRELLRPAFNETLIFDKE